MTFSLQIRKELADRHRTYLDDPDWSLVTFASFVAALGKIEERDSAWSVVIRVTGNVTATLLEAVARTLNFPLEEKKRGRRDVTLRFAVPPTGGMALFFDFDGWMEEVGERGMEPVFSSFFLACGVMSDPSTGRYRLAFSPSAGGAVNLMSRLFTQKGLKPGISRHQGRLHLLFTSGEEVARFLLLCGAHHALLVFEEKRSERELLGQVNRLVNFDDANAGRRAESIARQLEAIAVIERLRGLDWLPPQLAEASRARLENRGASLEELGAAMIPPVSKSGMSHRFSRIRAMARSLLGED
ncbi:MAG: DNA-binding protein WhiA [Clostridiaceae bacterium]|jgi:DNA-binding transcriptional regulator WhiA|nr:DNA-binding protein WhiA [Clostridiaceae bacterium]